MRTLQTIAGFDAYSGGTSTCTYELLAAMHRMSCDVDLMTLQATDLMGYGEKWIKALPDDSISSYGYSRNINRFLQQSDYDLYHTNGLWMHCNHQTCMEARKKSKPYIITSHGMLYPEALKRSYWKKWPFIQLFFKKDIHDATCIHVTCKQEMEYIRQFGYKGAIAVVPNPIKNPDYIESIKRDNSRKRFGFLGRLHPRKGVERILYAAGIIKEHQKDFEISIMGAGEIGYENFLKSEIQRLQLNNVRFCGFLSGQEKFKALASLSALFVPSDFENFGMIIPEALSVGTPVMASLGTPWEELNTRQCGWWVDRSPENIAKIMNEILHMDISQLEEMGQKGKFLVAECYEAGKVAFKMDRLYTWILEGGEKPDFVYTK